MLECARPTGAMACFGLTIYFFGRRAGRRSRAKAPFTLGLVADGSGNGTENVSLGSSGTFSIWLTRSNVAVRSDSMMGSDTLKRVFYISAAALLIGGAIIRIAINQSGFSSTTVMLENIGSLKLIISGIFVLFRGLFCLAGGLR